MPVCEENVALQRTSLAEPVDELRPLRSSEAASRARSGSAVRLVKRGAPRSVTGTRSDERRLLPEDIERPCDHGDGDDDLRDEQGGEVPPCSWQVVRRRVHRWSTAGAVESPPLAAES